MNTTYHDHRLLLPPPPISLYSSNGDCTTISLIPDRNKEVEEERIIMLKFNTSIPSDKDCNSSIPPPPLPSAPDLYVILFPDVDDQNAKSQNPIGDLFSDVLVKSNTVLELKSLFSLSIPIGITALLFYSRSIISTLFLGSLGDLPLAAGSLAIAFANITGYSVLAGLSLGMDPICSQSFGNNNTQLLSLTLHRSILFLLACSIPISFLWVHLSSILVFLGQNREITSLAQTYLYFALPDLISFSFIHPIRVYLRSQTITTPLTLAATFAAVVHIPANFVLVKYFDMGFRGVAAAAAFSNISLLLFLITYIVIFHWDDPTWQLPTWNCLTGWGSMVKLAAPSCASVCLEWWWYEIMIVFCGLLPNPKATVASMGVLIQTTAFLYVFPSSLGLGISTRVGNELGASRPQIARASAILALTTSVVMGLTSMAFALSMRDRWGRWFTDDVEIQRLTSMVLPIVGLCEIGNCPQTVGCGVLRGCARPGDAANVNLVAFYLVGMPVAVGLGFYFGLGFRGLWIGLLAAQICSAGLMVYVVRTTDWEFQAQRAQKLTFSGGREIQIARELETAVVEMVRVEDEKRLLLV